MAPDPDQRDEIVRANRNALRSWTVNGGDNEVNVRYEHKFKICRHAGEDVVAKFENGAEYKGSLIVAADGVFSAGNYHLSRSKLQTCANGVIQYDPRCFLTSRQKSSQ